MILKPVKNTLLTYELAMVSFCMNVDIAAGPWVLVSTLEIHYVYSTLKQRRNNSCFHVVSTWNTRGVFVG